MPYQFDSHVRDFVIFQQVRRILRYPDTFKIQTAEQSAMLNRIRAGMVERAYFAKWTVERAA